MGVPVLVKMDFPGPPLPDPEFLPVLCVFAPRFMRGLDAKLLRTKTSLSLAVEISLSSLFLPLHLYLVSFWFFSFISLFVALSTIHFMEKLQCSDLKCKQSCARADLEEFLSSNFAKCLKFCWPHKIFKNVILVVQKCQY